MDVVVIVVLGVLAGVGVYLASMRWERTVTALRGEGFLPDDERRQREALAPAEAAAPSAGGGAYVPLAPGRRSVQTRLFGLLGILVLLPIAAFTFALVVYSVGRVVVETITRLVESAST